MLSETLKSIFNQFDHQTTFASYEELASGHINDTYLIKTNEKPFFVLQQINSKVFKDVPALVNNKMQISKHLREKLASIPERQLNRRVLTFIPTKEGVNYLKDASNNYWNLMVFIEDSQTYEKVEHPEIAFEAGKLFGEFLALTSDFDTSKLTEVIPKFHSMSFRYKQFDEALKNASKERIKKTQKYIDFIQEVKEEMHTLERFLDTGKIPLRVTHNDTKISNALFDTDNKSLCVIDTDTVMPGIVHYDFGDAIRTICNTAAEDENNLELVTFNKTFYDAYTKGFIEKVGDSLSNIEIEYLPLGAKTMMFIMGLRFLTDYLNNDVYYKTAYPEHNLHRAKNQFKLIESFDQQMANSLKKSDHSIC